MDLSLSARLLALDVAQTLRNIPDSQRSLFTKLAVAAILLFRSRIFAPVLRRSNQSAHQRDATAEDSALLYVDEGDGKGTKTLFVPFGGNISKVRITPTPTAYLAATSALFPRGRHKSPAGQLLALLRIAFPSVRSKQALLLLLHSAFLVLRTYLSVLVARLDGKIVRDLVSANARGFARGLVLWFLLAVPSTYTNSMLRHLQSKLSLHLRTRLTRYAHDLYLASAPLLRYYRVSHGPPAEALPGVDQYITADIASFCDALSALYGNLMKPALDLLIFTSQLSRALGGRGTVLLFVNYYATARVLRAVTPAFGRLAAVERGLEGEFRAGMARVGREGEEIAFYDGGARERDTLWRAYLRLVKHINSIYKIRIAYEWTEDFVIKYAWSAAGYILISIPILFTRRRRSLGVQATSAPAAGTSPDDAIADRTENYISSRRLLLSLADAGGRLMYAYKDVLELAGLAARLYALFATLHALPPRGDAARAHRVVLRGVDVVVPGAKPGAGQRLVAALSVDLAPCRADDSAGGEDNGDAGDAGEADEGADFEPVTADGAPVAATADAPGARMRAGEHLMITGANGVGKTAIARVIAGLWPAAGGALARPARGPAGVFVVPQRAYMVVGSLLDQMIYPHSYAQFRAAGRTTEDLMAVLRVVHLAHLPAREGGWHTVKEWRDVLSGGEKQRMGMARVFYHRPQFAVLDECTSAVSGDVEGAMYQHAKDLGITLITLSLRPSLAKYHTRLLSLAGDAAGGWTLTRVGTAEERQGIRKEIAGLEGELAEVRAWEARVRELEGLLGATHEGLLGATHEGLLGATHDAASGRE